jgi:hypothetical protein
MTQIAMIFLLAAVPYELQVHIDADRPGVELRSAENDAVICTAPCDRAVPYDSRLQYVLAGEQVARSDAFSFAWPGPVNLTVHAGPAEWWNAGKMSMILGVIGVATGALLEAQAKADDAAYKEAKLAHGLGCLIGSALGRKCPPAPRQPDTGSLHLGAYIAVGAGALATLVGYLITNISATTWTSDRASVEGGPHRERPADPARDAAEPALQEAHQPDVEESPLEEQQEGQ